MGFNSVFHSLQELFPQVDVRILKAVAIEHCKDVDAAVESILSEVLPVISSSQEVLSSSDKHGVEQEETFCLGPQEAVEVANAGLPSEIRPISSEVTSWTDHPNGTLSIKSTSLDEAVSSSLVLSSRGVNDFEELFVGKDKEGLMPTSELREDSFLDGSHFGPLAVPSYLTHETAILSDGCNDTLHSDIQGLNGDITHDSLSFSCGEDRQGHACLAIGSPNGGDKLPTAQLLELPVPEDKQDSMRSEALNSFLSGSKGSGSICSLERGVEQMVFENQMGKAIDKSLPLAVAAQSGQIFSIEFLEEFISDVKNNKKTLVVALESLLDKARKVELQEQAAEQAKEEASRIGVAILAEVENLKQMVHEAKETYEMHAGEVFLEKSILGAKAQELQSRLLYLSSERDKSLSIIDEIHRNLEERMATAEAEKAAAENEKLEKEESARKALDAQVVIFEKMLQESKKLQQEAEGNAKLREFFMDQGHVVDALQGEIAVICEEVKLLKERIDGHLPISRSLLSSQISTSSSISSKRQSLEEVTHQAESSDGLNTPSQDHSPNDDQSRNMKSSQGQKTSLDEEWVFFFKDDTE